MRWDFTFRSDIFWHCIKKVGHTLQFAFLAVLHDFLNYAQAVPQSIKPILNLSRLGNVHFINLSIIRARRTGQEGGD
jgi:hypothetical protein